MTDRLGEAEVREFRQWVADATDDAIADYLARDLERIDQVAAARSWHTLTNPTDELIDRGAKALAYEAGKDISTWDSTPDQFLNPWREKARIVVDALSVTPTQEEHGPNTPSS